MGLGLLLVRLLQMFILQNLLHSVGHTGDLQMEEVWYVIARVPAMIMRDKYYISLIFKYGAY